MMEDLCPYRLISQQQSEILNEIMNTVAVVQNIAVQIGAHTHQCVESVVV